MEETVFEKIIKKEIPAHIVYENDKTLAFLDIAPNNEGHTLVIPKNIQGRNVLDMPSEALCSMMQTVHYLAPIIKKAVGADGVRIIMNNEKAGGQIVFYPHIHIIPMFEKNHGRIPFKKNPKPEQLATTRSKIISAV